MNQNITIQGKNITIVITLRMVTQTWIKIQTFVNILNIETSYYGSAKNVKIYSGHYAFKKNMATQNMRYKSRKSVILTWALMGKLLPCMK